MRYLSFVTPSVTLLSLLKPQVYNIIGKIRSAWQSSTDHHSLSSNSITKLAYSQEFLMWFKPLLPLYYTSGCYPFVTLDQNSNFKAQKISIHRSRFEEWGLFRIINNWGNYAVANSDR